MIKLNSEEWAALKSIPVFNKLVENLREERLRVAEMAADGELLDADNPGRTAINYALNVGRMQALAEIVFYKPQPEQEDQDNG